MGDLTPLVERALDELAPPRPEPDRWDEIERAALHPRWRFSRRSIVSIALTPVAVAALIAVAVLAWPFSGGSHGTLLERAAAAIGDGPVVHAVIQSGWGGTEIDLATGAKVAVHGEEELWYDPQRGVHDITLFAGVVQGDSLYPPGRVAYLDKTLAFLAIDYRQALKNGTAKVLGEDAVDGQPVYWIRVDTQMLPDVADGKLHEWAHDVAVSATTLKPVATRETRDGQLSPDGISKILSVETLGSGQGDFTASPAVNGSGDAMRFQLKGHSRRTKRTPCSAGRCSGPDRRSTACRSAGSRSRSAARATTGQPASGRRPTPASRSSTAHRPVEASASPHPRARTYRSRRR